MLHFDRIEIFVNQLAGEATKFQRVLELLECFGGRLQGLAGWVVWAFEALSNDMEMSCLAILGFYLFWQWFGLPGTQAWQTARFREEEAERTGPPSRPQSVAIVSS